MKPSSNSVKKLFILTASLVAGFTVSAHAGSWGFSLGNGAGFYWGNQPCVPVYSTPAYVAPAPVYYERPVVYNAPQTVYMQPYQQMRPVVYPQTVIYRSEPVVIHETPYRCRERAVVYPNRW